MKRFDKILALVFLVTLGVALDAQQVINGYRVLVNIAAASVGTPASGSTAIYVDSTTKKLATKDDAGTVVNYTSGGSSSTLLNVQGPATAVTGAGANATVYTYTITGGTMGANSCVRATVFFQHTTGSASVTYSWSYGGTAQGSAASAATTPGQAKLIVCGNGTTSTQFINSNADFMVGSTTFAATETTTGKDSTADEILLFQFNVANTDAVTPKGWIVENIK